MGEWRGKTVEIEITNVAHGGVAVARHDGRVIFVSDAIPGEVVKARITDDSKKSFWRAETLAVVTPSEFRQPHIWSAASIDRAPEDRPGGAEFGHINIDHQRELKRQVLADSLKRMAGVETDVTVEALAGPKDGTGWRTRVRLQVAADGTPGPYAARSHRVIPVTDLPLATRQLESIAPLNQKFVGEEQIEIVTPSVGSSFILTKDAKPTKIVERVGDREFHLDARGFWQVHRAAAQTLTTAVQEAIDADLFDPRAANLDLYGGVGLLAAAVGDKFGNHVRITTVESDTRATEHAGLNLSEWVGALAVTARVENYIKSLNSKLDKATVILDPPRAGAGKDVVEGLASKNPAQVIYVACDPVALARDVSIFQANGYELKRLRAFDLFPNTHHVEAVATLVKV
jgi:tRNA/tmRNA/rRNA uracil-C5-methylase (TrmA/RlmC/RlmD family)